MRSVRIIGGGRAGGALTRALDGSAWRVVDLIGRDGDIAGAAEDVDLVVIATPDDVIADVARTIRPSDTTVIAHMAGSRGLDDLGPHVRRAAIHPLVALPDAEIGAGRLRSGVWFATAGDDLVSELVSELGGEEFTIANDDRACYHAAAVIASNHLVAVLGQAERIGGSAGVPFEALMALVRATVDNVAELGPAVALTGPAARGDDETIQRHRDALPDEELAAYDALVAEARRLAGGR